jgi:hypothetical protein
MGLESDCFSFRQALRNRTGRVQEREIRAEFNAGFFLRSAWGGVPHLIFIYYGPKRPQG